MALLNTWFFTKTIINWEVIAKATHNTFKVVAVRRYVDKKGKLPEGYTLTVKVIKDDFDYGIDKDGEPRENNFDVNFDVTVLSRKHDVKKGDMVKLLDFDSENSFAFDFDLVIRFRDYEVIKSQPGKTNA